ncbi:hypothetical protein EV586_10696 [Tumebacillus sp. BK434]|uniref:hypothetical protein n=1 Tax=Tumebacillus sp. BK434 TaxID=2512169 RepID=UPI00104F7032|nr:hypothetical protein [Tumebacillus sp. BK434]TCP53362.1 hypothetical protein EV586_10696 [Tumebacillus sp. BK434]
MINKRLQELSLLAGGTILVLAASVLLVTALFWALGQPISKWNLALGAGCAALALAFGVNRYVEGALRKAGVFAGVLAFVAALFWLSVQLGGSYLDVSYDGQGYHTTAVIKLHDGWNPFHQPDTGNVWNDHYAKGAETLAAALYKVTGHLEQGKAWNFLLLCASFLLAWAGLLSWDRQVWRALLGALVLAWNPVVLNQTLSFYLDGQLGALLLCLLGLGALIAVRGDRWIALVTALALVLILNNKFTGVVYAAVLSGGLLLLLYAVGKRRVAGAMAGVILAAFVAGILFVGWNPYVLNTLEKGHPFYPVAGDGKLDIMAQQVPGNLIGLPAWQKLGWSLFARSENVLATQQAELKLPFTWTQQEVKAFQGPDPRIGGWGPLFGGALLLGIVIAGLCFLLTSWRQALLACGVLLLVIFSVLLNPEAWWARFTPQLWLVPALAAAYGLLISNRRALQALSLVLLLLMGTNSWLTSHEYFARQSEYSALAKQQLAALQRASQEQPIPVLLGTGAHARRFAEHGVSFVAVKKLACASKTQLQASVTFVCTPPELKEKKGM